MAYFPSVFACGGGRRRSPCPDPPPWRSWTRASSAFVRKHDSQIDAMLPRAQTDTAILVEFEGPDEAEVDAQFAALRTPPGGHRRPADGRPGETVEETERLWTCASRRWPWPSGCPGPREPLPFIEDVTVHPTEVPGYVDFLQRLFDRDKVEAVMYGHVGDGNIHTRPMLDPKEPARSDAPCRRSTTRSPTTSAASGAPCRASTGTGSSARPTFAHVRRRRLLAVREGQGCFRPVRVCSTRQEDRSAGRQHAHASRYLRYGADYRDPAQPEAHLLHFPGERIRARDREVPRVRPVQEHGRHHDVPHLQGHETRARVAAGEGQPAARHHHRGARPRDAPTASRPPRWSPTTASCAGCARSSARPTSTSPS